MKKSDNLRGREALVLVDGTERLVAVITHTRGERWLVEGEELPMRFVRRLGLRRMIVRERDMILVPLCGRHLR